MSSSSTFTFTFTLSRSLPFLKTRYPNPNLLSSQKPLNHVSFNTISSKPTCSYGLWTCVPSLVHGPRGQNGFIVKAAEKTEETVKPSSLFKTLELGVLIVFWYLLTILFNIYNKQILKDYPFPVTISALHLGIGTLLVLFMWTFKLHNRPKISTSQLVAIVPLAIAHTLGNLFTNMSLGKVSVSFAHTIKAMEPFFSVVLSALFLGEDYLDNITLFSIITIMSFILIAPVALLVEGVKFSPAYLQSAGLNVQDIYLRSLLAGLFYHGYQQVSYVILERVSPVTHSVSNCVKRIVIIVGSVLFFRTPVSPINSIGTGVALAGVFLYSRLKTIKPRPKSE
ncbi:hypothetical protein IFM89_038777 [Coptis chinensis]|uniref:Sugar phosphate transporter domain-containing protein n=1 Tax=Coptis chinensis TaxID=261450 RepID=A0A835J1R9_9MAGN|nr:hypothetical protein IFM89_038777 [Coptis chinensis]